MQLAGGHIDSNTNNPNENIGQWKAGLVKPLCVFSPTRLQEGPKVTATMGWSDIPTCKEAGIPVDQFQMPRTVWLPGGVPAEAVAFYADLLKKVSETPEWKEYIERTSQTGQLPGRRGAEELHRRRTMRRTARSSSRKAGSFARLAMSRVAGAV